MSTNVIAASPATCHCGRAIEMEAISGELTWLHQDTGWTMCSPRETPVAYAAPALGSSLEERRGSR